MADDVIPLEHFRKKSKTSLSDASKSSKVVKEALQDHPDQHKVVAFRPQIDSKLRALKSFADALDHVILEHLKADGLNPQQIAGVMAHRLGHLVGHLDAPDEREWTLLVCDEVMKTQAASRTKKNEF